MRLAACEKKRYLTRRRAKWFARQLRNSGLPELSPYRCHDCGLWHLTSQSAARKAAYRAYDAREGP